MASVSRIVRQTAPMLVAAPAMSLRWAAAGAQGRCRGGISIALRLGASGRRGFSSTGQWRSVATPAVSRGDSKLFSSADEAVADIQSGSVLLSSGFGLCGVACEFPSHVDETVSC